MSKLSVEIKKLSTRSRTLIRWLVKPMTKATLLRMRRDNFLIAPNCGKKSFEEINRLVERVCGRGLPIGFNRNVNVVIQGNNKYRNGLKNTCRKRCPLCNSYLRKDL